MPDKLSLADCMGILAIVTANAGLTTKEITHKCIPYITSRQTVRKRLLYLRDKEHISQETRMEKGKRTSRWYPK